MKDDMCLVERFTKINLAVFFLVVSIAFLLSGFTVFPIFGIIFSIPVFLLSLFFFRVHLNKNCEIE